jgi:ABC-2 type transport system ATP-binding protein
MDISIENLSKSYGPQKAVDNISFKVNTGEILGFLGPNGAGKTTTMKMITNYIQPDGGDICINNTSIKNQDFKPNIGYLPEHNPLYLDMPVIDYLAFCAQLQGVKDHELDTQIRKMVQLCGLDAEKHKKIGELSKGYRQRVGLAQAMIHDPEILILDEPTTGLDPNQIVEIRELIKTIGREKTVILSTHILPEVEATCDRILIINNGEIVADGTPASLRTQAQGQQILSLRIEDGDPDIIRKKLSGLANIAEAKIINLEKGTFEVISKSGVKSNRDIFNMCVQEKWSLTEMTPIETKLEDIFRDLTSN